MVKASSDTDSSSAASPLNCPAMPWRSMSHCPVDGKASTTEVSPW